MHKISGSCIQKQ